MIYHDLSGTPSRSTQAAPDAEAPVAETDLASAAPREDAADAAPAAEVEVAAPHVPEAAADGTPDNRCLGAWRVGVGTDRLFWVKSWCRTHDLSHLLKLWGCVERRSLRQDPNTPKPSTAGVFYSRGRWKVFFWLCVLMFGRIHQMVVL